MKRVPFSHTTYFGGEGRAYMEECLSQTFAWAHSNDINRVVIFTGTGEGAVWAARNLLPQYPDIRVVAVTPPAGRPYFRDPTAAEKEVVRAGVSSSVREFLHDFAVPVVAAHLPFKPIQDDVLSPWAHVERAFGILGGGFALAVQAALVACDAGEVHVGERVVAMTADTAIAVFATRTESFLSPRSGLVVEHVICRPRTYSISKPDHLAFATPPPPSGAPPSNEVPGTTAPRQLPVAKTKRGKP